MKSPKHKDEDLIALKSGLIDLCGFSPVQADIIVTNHEAKAKELISGLISIAEQVNYLKEFYKEFN